MTTAVRWQATAADGAARSGVLHTPHGPAATPCFMAVGTGGALKGITVDQAEDLGQQVLLANTYHLALRPGAEAVHQLGGLHRFCGWRGPMLTDSGGYQVFSLAQQRRIDEEGVHFRSHLDGTALLLSPEESLRIQRLLGADIVMAFDECPPAEADRAYHQASLERTLRWLDRSVAAWRAVNDLPGGSEHQALYGIVQGGLHADLRRASAIATVARGLPGVAIGGLSVGETFADRLRVLDAVLPHLPGDRPRYLMGVGTPLDLVEAIARGVDQFDCVLPTRMGRHGIAYSDDGPLHLKREQYKTDPAPIDADTPSPAQRVGRGYLRHLIKSGEMLGGILLSLHNLAYYQRLLARCRSAIGHGTFTSFADDFRRRYQVRAPAWER